MERDEVTSLNTLLVQYVSVADIKDTAYQKQHMQDVITQLTEMASQLDDCFRVSPKGPLLSALVVCWFHAPISHWAEQTYATFFSAFVCTFFNPHCVLPSALRRLMIERAAGIDSASDIVDNWTPSDDEVQQIQLLFGRVLKFVHTESAALANYFDPIVAYFYPTQKHWSTCGLFEVYERVISIWSRCLADVDRKGNSKNADERAQLQECMVKGDAALLGAGLKQSLGQPGDEAPFPSTLASAVMQYYAARLETMKKAVVAKMMDQGEADGAEERAKRREDEMRVYEVDSLETQMQRMTTKTPV